MNLEIRPEREVEFSAIDALIARAFGQQDEATLVEKLRRHSAYVADLALVAIRENGLVGFVLFSEITIGQGHIALALAPMSVEPDLQKHGIGSQLVTDGLRRCQNLNYPGVVVLGHANYYPRFGFQRASSFDIHAPFEVPDEVFMARELKPGAFDHVSGVVVYPEPFGI